MDNSSIQQMGYKDDVRTQYVYYVSTKEIEERKAEEEQRKEEQDKRQFKLYE